MFGRVLIVTAVLFGTVAWADIDSARKALDRGDFDKAIEELRPLAEGGDVEAQYWLGRTYDASGIPELAFGWFEKAARNDHPDAQRVLGIYYYEGRSVARDDLAAACWYRESAVRGNDKAQRYLGLMFADGVGTARNDEKAAYWLTESVRQGNADARRNLAHLYYFGVGVEMDRNKAAELMSEAASGGVISAKSDLGKLYYRGRGVPRDFGRAKELLMEAAADGDITAQYYLGRMYAQGEGIERNDAEAYFWFALAAAAVRDQDDPNPDGWRAHEWLAKIKDRLQPEQIRTAEDRAHAWRRQ